MRLSMKSIHPAYYYVLSLIIIVLLYTKVNVEVAALYIVSAGLSLYLLKCHCRALIIGLLVVGLYMMSMNVREGMKESAVDKRTTKAAADASAKAANAAKAAKAAAKTKSPQKNKLK
jgi:hypothetical protein